MAGARAGRARALMTPAPIIDVLEGAEALALQVARFVAARISNVPARFSLSLSGGTTPNRIYELLGTGDLGVSLDWRKLYLFWGDERFVPMDHHDSNFRTARKPSLLFDLTPLGLGEDSHIASLFPGTKALDERNAWVTSTIGTKPEPRISLTYPAPESSGVILFVVSGAKKRDILARVLANDLTLPASRLSSGGIIRVFADRAALPV
ncbi:MAG: 6-phosphogluconolactonase [Beijerinckiaceae bacterium]|nr:MAG: 6-phosphogluconolactonase [Beijerinckiaceae bacterium]